ncbi:TIGR03364 family FAD-dependent oxidoreductase [Rhizobium multihospitium]|uniref:FAD dependent oxidoreductase TIGR03364 n=1 Tax=Rhizobium multihospitium TaxID=410764 RepID=A0A1C3UDD7_9HYPH|nr:TIGR03364 family FAD-dependent oxidoreductase [Rhizobium multihospitium]SCB13536.1 FAD dependent oxidoreductase TIGR03364 [Rhizobium multihospitium]
MANGYDLAVVGAGIVGIGVALAAVRQGKKVVVIERNAKAVGASIRNFGFVTISGQKAGAHWERAMRARDIWSEIVDEAGIAVIHRGLVMPARRPEAAAVVDAFLKTPMGEKCRLMTKAEAGDLVPSLRLDGVETILYSPHELRVESSEALPKLAAWLEARHKVDFRWNTAVRAIEGTRIETSHGTIEADAVVVCPGDDFSTLFPDVIARHPLTICTLQMLRVTPAQPSRFGAAVMSDMSLARYEGFADLPEGQTLGKRLDIEEAESRAAGIHLIAVQSADGSLVVGDSHVYGNAQQPFASERFDQLILDEFDRVFDLPGRTVVNRWIGTYASSKERTVLVERPADHIRLVMVTGGTGASTGFALGEQVIGDLYSSTSRSWE